MFDILIKDGTIIDGSGSPMYSGSIGIVGKTIESIGSMKNKVAKITIDAQGKVVCPGFIDIHSHADLVISREDHNKILKPLIMQGITSFIGGNCGFSNSLIPDEQRKNCISYIEAITVQSETEHINWKTPAEFMEKIQKKGMLLNMGLLAGHGSLRIAVAGLARRFLSISEQKKMEGFLETSMEMGCLGLSSGLQYFPGLQSDIDELVKTANILKKYDGVFTSHLRSYSHTLDNALKEVFEVGVKNDIRVLISHLYWQPYFKGLAGLVRKALQFGSFLYNTLHLPIPMEKGLVPKLQLIENARNDGLDVYFDQVPTAQGFTTLFAFLPPYVVEGSKAETLNRLKDKQFRKKVLNDIETGEPDWPHNEEATWSFNYIKMTGWSGLRVMAIAKEENKWMEGKTFPEIGKALKKSPMDAMCDLLIEENGKVLVFHAPTKPDDAFVFRSVWKGFTHPLSVPTTDTVLLPLGRPSHVFYDCFPRFIEFFAKQKNMVSLETAIKKCTSMPADIMRIKKRGRIESGSYADILILDMESLGTSANFYNPRVYPTGIETVIVNGEIVLKEGCFQENVLAGNIIKSNDS